MMSYPSHSRIASVNKYPTSASAKRHQPTATPVLVSRKDTSIVSAPACYPTPPPSPDLEDSSLPVAPTLATASSSSSIVTVQLEDLDDLDFEEADPQLPQAPKFHARFPAIPIPILLNTPHELPQAATFRLRSPASLLALFAGSRVLTLDSDQTIWDRMPYSAAAAAIHGRRPATEEDSVENLVGGANPERKVNGIHWNLRQQK